MAVCPRVLVVDDNVELAEDLGELLELAGAEVVLARDGREAMDRLAAEPYALVLTDMQMPRASGLEVVQTARSVRPSARVVVMTAYASESALDDVRAYGTVQILEKPVDLDALTGIVAELGAA